MLQLVDILVGSPAPLHPYLAKNSRLSVRVILNKKVYAETATENGDLKEGIWEIGSSLQIPEVDQLSLAVVAKNGGLKLQLSSAILNVKELVERVKVRPKGYHEIIICESWSPVQFIMTCSVKVSSLSAPPVVGTYGHLDVPKMFLGLGSVTLQRFNRFGKRADIEAAISSLQRAVDLTPDGHPDRLRSLSDLGDAYSMRFERLECPADLENAILYQELAVVLMPDVHPYKPCLLSNLGVAFRHRFEARGNLTDLEAAISSLQNAVKLAPDGHSDLPKLFTNLGSAFLLRYNCLDKPADIEDAIWSIRHAVELTPDGDPIKPIGLNNLGTAFYCRFSRLGTLADLESAISYLQRAVDLAPDNNRHKSGWLVNLGGAFRCRFDHLGSVADIENAIARLQTAVELASDGHPDRALSLDSLGSALQMRFKRLGERTDIDDAISNLQLAVNLTADGLLHKLNSLCNLGAALLVRFEHFQNPSDVEDAISSLQSAVDLTPDGNSDKPLRLTNLGFAFTLRFRYSGNLEDIEDAISSLQPAVELTPDGHPAKLMSLCNLGTASQLRFERLGNQPDIERAISAISTAAKSPIGPAMTRFRAALTWATVAYQSHSQFPRDAFSCAIDLLPRIAWLGLAVPDQHALLAEVGDVVRNAVAGAIEFEEYETAVEWVEQGRSIVWQNLLGLRNPVDDLRMTHPHLANKLQDISRQMEASVSHGDDFGKTGAASAGGLSRMHAALAISWDNTVEEIRGIPGFDAFLRPKAFTKLASAVYEGPVVILNLHNSRCDAFILIPDESGRAFPVNVHLEDFSYKKSQELLDDLKSLLLSTGVRDRDIRQARRVSYRTGGNEAKFKSILRTLWLCVVQPVIAILAYKPQTRNLPRIWWCATGSLAFLPIHAAGDYDAVGTGEKVSDYVVSSYTPTLTAILDTSYPATLNDFKLLTVAQPSAQGASHIPNTVDEVERIQRIAGDLAMLKLVKEEATVERVLHGMRNSSWIHLACHGQQNAAEPMKSGLLLYDGTLELSTIVKEHLSNADFAFLSACQTAMGDEKVADESVHLAAGLFLSGYRGIIATRWAINDKDAPQIAENVYRQMLSGGRPDRKKAAHALHEAVKQLRESGASLVSWVPFIHIGR